MATSLLYLSPYLGSYSILVTASSGGVCVCGCCGCYSYYGCCGVAEAAIRVTSGAAIGTTYSTAVRIASKISGGSYRYYCGHYCRDSCKNSCRDSCGA